MKEIVDKQLSNKDKTETEAPSTFSRRDALKHGAIAVGAATVASSAAAQSTSPSTSGSSNNMGGSN